MSAVTSFVQVAQAVADAFTAAPSLAGGRVKSNPVRPWSREVASAISVRLVNASRIEGTNCGEIWAVSLVADIEARATDAASLIDPAEAVDELLSAVAQRVAELDLSALGVTERAPESGVSWEFDTAETPMVLASYGFGFHIHVTDQLTVPAP